MSGLDYSSPLNLWQNICMRNLSAILLLTIAVLFSVCRCLGEKMINPIIEMLFGLILFLGQVLGIIRGVKNGSKLHSLLSVVLPLYGVFYFFIGRRKI